jgi:Arc/MetJ family transcription regulator
MRTMIDIDDALMAEAKKIFGTTTKKATVERALIEAIDRKKRLDYVKAQKANPDWKPRRYKALMARTWK